MKADRIQDMLEKIPGWSLKKGPQQIVRTYELPSFRAAVAFVSYVAELAEAADHHPQIEIRHRKVTLRLSTHSAGELTAKDFELAALIDARD
jgi:4a-hydroxytetrahydrobiopterin dehydratase